RSLRYPLSFPPRRSSDLQLRRPDPRTSSRGRTRKPLLVGAARPRLLPLRSVEQGRTHFSPPDRTRPGGQLGTHRIGPHPGTAEPARGGGHLPAYARGHVRRQPGLIGLTVRGRVPAPTPYTRPCRLRGTIL